jgi:signal transduction histidine kinase
VTGGDAGAASLAIPDRVPSLPELLRADDLRRCLAPFLAGAVDGALLFDRDGRLHGGAAGGTSPMRVWEQVPAEAEAALRSAGTSSFGLGHHVFDVRAVYAGTDRVGLLVVSRHANRSDARDVGLADALAAVVGQLLHAGFAAWVTSEMHLASSQSSHDALTKQNAELQRAIAHLREIDELKSNFLATVSHELRTPLTSIIGFSEMLIDGIAGDLAAEQIEYVRPFLHRGEELLQLISQLLEMSQMEVGALRLDLRAVPLHDVIARAVESVRLAATQAGVRIDEPSDESPTVLCDPEKLHRVLVNLIGNAIKFSRGGGTVTLAAVPAPIRQPFAEETLFGEEIADAVRVTVRDTGVGIPPDQLSRVFEAFYQVDAGPTRRHGGAGLGLSIVKNLVKAHGGDVWAESEVGVGTAVHFTVPMAAPAV